MSHNLSQGEYCTWGGAGRKELQTSKLYSNDDCSRCFLLLRQLQKEPTVVYSLRVVIVALYNRELVSEN